MSTNPPFERIHVKLNDAFGKYFANRARQHINDSYMGVPMLKFPESLRLYEHILWASDVDCVIEIGCLHGGSTLWFRDRLEALNKYRKTQKKVHVFSIDKSISSARKHISNADPEYDDTITLIEGNVQDPQVSNNLERLVPRNARCLVVEDSAHIYETTFAALKNFSKFVPQGGFFIVEDGYLDTELKKEFSPEEMTWDGVTFGGVTSAIQDWTKSQEGKSFKIRTDWELYGLSISPQGILERA